MDAVDLLVDALEQVGFQGRDVALSRANPRHAPDDADFDLLLDPSGVGLRLEVKWRALVTDDVAARLVKQQAHRSRPGTVLLVVGDRVTESARAILLDQGAGYLDLRGRIALRTQNIIIDAPIEPMNEPSRRTDPLAGKVGLEVAIAILMAPTRSPGVRQLANELGRSASTVSEILSTMRREGLLDSEGEGASRELFWAVADRWPTKRTYLAHEPSPGLQSELNSLEPPSTALRLGLKNVRDETGWALTDTRAAAVYGAPVVARADQLRDFLVPDAAILRRAQTMLGSAPAREARAAIRIAPVPAACRNRVDLESLRTPENHWPLAHPLFVALDLAQDAGRGREILNDWDPRPWGTRVW